MGDPLIQNSSPPPERFSLPRILSLSAAVRSLKPRDEEPRGEPPRVEPWYKRRLTRLLAAGAIVGGSAAAIALLELSEDAKPTTVSGSPRLKLTDSGEFVRWRKKVAELTIDPSFEQLGPEARDVVAVAYATWSSERAHLPALSIDMATTPRRVEYDGVNLVTYAPIELPGHQQSLGATVAYMLADGTITEVDTIINSRKPFEVIAEREGTIAEAVEYSGDDEGNDHDHDQSGADDSDQRGDDEHVSANGSSGCVHSYDLQSVVTHEAGHFFGLGEDQENREATMYFKTGRCDTKQRDLIDEDLAAVETVYAEPPPVESDGTSQAATCAMRSTGRAPGGAWSLLALLGTLRASRRVRAYRRRSSSERTSLPVQVDAITP